MRPSPAAVAALCLTTGCYSWTTPPSLRPGMQVRVETPAPMEVRDTMPPTPVCHATRVEGRLETVRADALTIRPAAFANPDDESSCALVRHALVPTNALGTFVTVRAFDRKKTTYLVVGGVAMVGLMLLVSDQPSNNTVY
ncbi:MAG TPA: hypothetical protein VF761_01085 [Gemmatimonadaceae bacterium]